MSSPSRGVSPYLYERLGNQRFQQLCHAVLTHLFPNVICFPVGQADGGRDARRRVQPAPDGGRGGVGQMIYQVKWTAQGVRQPVSWLDATIKKEATSITRLVEEGATTYVLLTNVAGTGTRTSGTMDRLDERLAEHGRQFGITMDCWWRADLDARVATAPRELTWSFAEMLAGHEAIRYLIEADHSETQRTHLRDLVQKAVAAQWQEDAKVKFRQVELDSYDLADLFVDVGAHRLSGPENQQRVLGLPRRFNVDQVDAHDGPGRAERGHVELGGAAAYLQSADHPMTVVRGEPGQGKSTLGQFLCQVHRAALLGRQEQLGGDPVLNTALPAARTRVPLRVDLRDYGLWLDGGDPFADTESEPARQRPRKLGTLEEFLAALLTTRSGGRSVDVPGVQDLLSRFPSLIVLDGLDEVARSTQRARVVNEINMFCARLTSERNAGSAVQVPTQVVVTTRPNFSGLPEPTTTLFETVALSRLGPALRTRYLRKWVRVRGIRGAAGRELQRIFDSRSGEQHVAQLADNPMQLTILLYLMQRRGESVPTGRTDLYRSYLETFLDREASKTSAVRRHRTDLEEVTAFLGWRLQSQAEGGDEHGEDQSGRMRTAAIKSAINSYLYETGKNTALVEDLFTAVTDRVWALSSKVDGTFEFDVQPMREFFAAQYLYQFARTSSTDLSRAALLRELLTRPYWLNTARFYAGFANPNEIAGLVEGLEDALEAVGEHARQARIATWVLLGDGVFAARPRTQRRVADLLTDDLSVRLLLDALQREEISALPADRGALDIAARLAIQVQAEPGAALAQERIELAVRLAPDQAALRRWGQEQLAAAAATPQEGPWLRIAGPLQAGRSLSSTTVTSLVSDASNMASALGAGIDPERGSDLDRRLVTAVLDGVCSDITPVGSSTAADLLRLAAPQHLLRLADSGEALFAVTVAHPDRPTPASPRRAALKRLTEAVPDLSHLGTSAQFGRGQLGTTSPWGNTARALARVYGPCWLAAEIAIIGAASPTRYRTEGDITPHALPFGSGADYGQLLQLTRRARSHCTFWTEAFEGFSDDLSRASWILALLAVATPDVIIACREEFENGVDALPAQRRTQLCESSSRIGAWRLRRRLPAQLLIDMAPQSVVSTLLLSHHIADHQEPDPLLALPDETISALAGQGAAGWPAQRAVAARVGLGTSPELRQALAACGAGSAVDRAVVPREMAVDLAVGIVAAPDLYPLAWVDVAEQRLARQHVQQPIGVIAEKQGWFDSP